MKNKTKRILEQLLKSILKVKLINIRLNTYKLYE